jgi:hypothetical protein
MPDKMVCCPPTPTPPSITTQMHTRMCTPHLDLVLPRDPELWKAVEEDEQLLAAAQAVDGCMEPHAT